MLRKKMLQTINQGYLKITKKISHQLSDKALKIILYSVLVACWGIILLGTFLLLN